MAAPGVCITPHCCAMCSDHSNAPISATDTCSCHCHPNWLALSPAPAAANTIIYKYWSLYKLCPGNTNQSSSKPLLNLYILHFMGHLNLCHSIKFISHSCQHLAWAEGWGLTNLLWSEGGCKCSFNSELRWLLLSPELDIHVLHIMRLLSCHQERWSNAQEAEFQTWTFKLSNTGNY